MPALDVTENRLASASVAKANVITRAVMSQKSDDIRFGELRAILHGEPDEHAWQQLCEFFDAFPAVAQNSSDSDEAPPRGGSEWEEKFLAYACSIVRHWPISFCQPSWSWLHQLYRGESHPKFKLLRSLRLRSRIADDDLINLCHEPHLDHISSLYILGMELRPDQIHALAGGVLLENLTHLELWSNGLDHHLLTLLFKSTPALASNLESLELPKNRVGDMGAEAIANVAWRQLRALNLWHTGLTNTGAKALEASPHLGNLEQLNLGSNTGISHDILERIEQSEAFAPKFELRF